MAKAGASRFLPPEEPLDATLVRWGRGETLYRVHRSVYAVNLFNPSTDGNARFSPIFDPAANVIPTIYAATTPRGALMETIFHDVPYAPGLKRVSASRVSDKLLSKFVLNTDLQLVDLSKVALRRLGIQPRYLIESTKARYPQSRAWAERLYREYPKMQGLQWTSRQDDRSVAMVIFGSRVQRKDIISDGPSEALLRYGLIHPLVLAVAAELKVLLR